MKFQSSLVAVCALFFVCTALAHPDVTDVTFSPNWVHIRGGDVINVCGCGFSKYDNVICLWNNRWASSYSAILDDGNILCESPAFDAEEMTRNGGAPQNMRLDIVFDGDYNYLHFLGWVRVGPEIDPYDPIDPSAGYVNGGGSMSVYGQGFEDIWGSDLEIYFDDVPCAGSSSVVSDTELRCNSVPRGALSQDAVVTVKFFASQNNSAYFYLHALETWAYGPRFDRIEPSCASPFGGTAMAIKGTFLDDPAATSGVTGVSRPMIVLFTNTDDIIQVFGNFQGANTIQFTSPDLVEILDTTSDNLWMQSVAVEVYSQQVMSINQRTYPTDLSYTLGAYLYSARLPQVNGNTFATAANSWPHFGGEDQVCLFGCGWEQYDNLEGRLEMRTSTTSTGDSIQNICNGPSSVISVFGSGDESGVCCNSVVEHDTCTESRSRYWTVEQTVPDGSRVDDFFDGATLSAPTTIGPVFDLSQVGFITTLTGGSRSVTGKAFKYSNNAASSNAAGWVSSELCYTFSEYDPFDTTIPTGERCNSGTTNRIVIDSDTSLTIDLPGNDFDTTARITIDFADSECVNYQHTNNHWGPFCGEVDYFLGNEYKSLDSTWGLSVENGPVSGGNTFTITGTGLNQYGNNGDVKVLFCERFDSGVAGSCAGPVDAGCTDSRFVDNADQRESCTVYNLGGVSSLSNNSVSITTPRYSDEGILWGDTYDVYLYWGLDSNSYSDQYESDKSDVIDLTFGVDVAQITRKFCGRYRYGPTVDDSGCTVGPEGPAASRIPLNYLDGGARTVDPDADNGVLTPFTIPGTNMADNWSGLDRAKNPHKVFLGEALGADVTNPSATSVSTATLWDGDDQDVNVGVIFDTCNTSFSNLFVQYGPVIEHITCEGIPGNPANDGVTEVDLWGFKPYTRHGLYGPDFSLSYDDDNGYDIIRIRGRGFEEYCSDVFDDTLGSCRGEHFSYARAIIDSEYSPWTIIRQCDTIGTDSLRRGSLADDGCYEILAAVPPRPFGTVAQVAVEFGDTDCPSHNPSTEEPESGWDRSLRPSREIDWTRVLIATQKLHFEPKITSVTPDLVKSSLRDVTEFQVNGYGFTRWDINDLADTGVLVTPRCLLNHTPLGTGTIEDDTLITCPRPANLRGEFNTDVPFHVYFDNTLGEVVDPNFRQVPTNLLGDSVNYINDAYDWKIAAPHTIHEGPQCSIVSNYYDFSEEINLDISVFGFRDCEVIDGTPEIGERPDTAGTFDGELYCMHRDFDVELVVTTGSRQTRTILTVDSWNSSYSETGLTVNVRGLNLNEIDCDYTAYVQLRSRDAIVHANPANQRLVVCDNTFERGPRVTGASSEWFYNGVHYGWIGDDITVTGLNFIDSGDRLADPLCSFNGQRETPVSFNDNQIVCRAPLLSIANENNHWDVQVPVSIVWPSENAGEVACEQDAFIWHYGPGLIYQNYCLNPYHIDTSNQDVDVSIIAGGCCGLVTSQTRCIFPSDYNIAQTGYSENTGSVPDVLSCRVPQVSTPFTGIGGFGVAFFTETSSEFPHTIGSCNKNDGDKCLVETVDDRLNSICYGWRTNAVSPSHVRTSYIAEGDVVSAPHDVHAERVTISDVSSNSDYEDDLIVNIRCNLHREGTSSILDLGFAETISGDAAVCTLENATFTKHCRDTPDDISLTYILANNVQVQERETWNFPTSFSNNLPTTFGQSGDLVTYTLTHGPRVVSVTVADWSAADPAAGNIYDELRSFTSGGLSLSIQLSHYLDFVAENDGSFSSYDFGWENSIVSYGNLGYDFAPYYADIRSGSISTETPNGLFRSFGEIRVHLDPHTDALTDFGLSDNDYHFRPYITGMSRVYGNQAGHESIAFYGHGFCKDGYNQVYSHFGGPSPLGGYGACDLTNDHVVICQTPYSGDGARVTSPSLFFNDECYANCGDGALEVPSDIQYTYYGYISVTTPYEAPVYGYTDVTFNVLGLNFFDDVECWFDGANEVQYQGEVIARTDNSITCRTPNMEGVRATNPYLRVFHNPDYFKDCDGNVLYDPDSTDFTPISYLRPRDIIYSPNPIIFDEPCPLDVYTVNGNVGNVSEGTVEDGIEVFVEGRFFNGGREIGEGGTYTCQWRSYGSRDRFVENPRYLQETTATRREVIPEINQNFDWSTYRIVCPVPTDLVGGLWGVKIRWDEADTFSQCTAPFLVDSGMLLTVSPIVMVLVCIYQLLF